MRIPRAEIVNKDDLVHVYWRCHNRSKYLESKDVKDKILAVYFENAERFSIEIIDFTIMDNHAHFALKAAGGPEALGNFTRQAHSQIAVFINKKLKKDSQVFRDRYKSPVIGGLRVLRIVLAYILANRLKVNRDLKPENDPYCSAYHRLNNTPYSKFLKSYSALGLCPEGEEKETLLKILKKISDELNEVLSFGKSVCSVFVSGDMVENLKRARAYWLRVLQQRKIVSSA